MFKTKYSVRLINEKWELIKVFKLNHIPIKDEYIYIDEFKKYFKVVTVVHQLTKKHEVILVISEFNSVDIKIS